MNIQDMPKGEFLVTAVMWLGGTVLAVAAIWAVLAAIHWAVTRLQLLVSFTRDRARRLDGDRIWRNR